VEVCTRLSALLVNYDTYTGQSHADGLPQVNITDMNILLISLSMVVSPQVEIPRISRDARPTQLVASRQRLICLSEVSAGKMPDALSEANNQNWSVYELLKQQVNQQTGAVSK